MSDFHLSLADEWEDPEFNPTDFLFSCSRCWRHKPRSVSSNKTKAQLYPALSFSDLVEGSECEAFTASMMAKYWSQRYRLFSRFDLGILVDVDGLFSATPEAIAAHQARRLKSALLGSGATKTKATDPVVLDVCSGTGVNSIQLALFGFNVVAVECDPSRIAMASRNAEVYGVASKIKFICADFFEWAPSVSRQGRSFTPFSAAVLSPPWGGPSYSSQLVFDMNTIQFATDKLGRAGATIWSTVRWASWLAQGNLALFLPKNTNMAQVLNIAGQMQGAPSADPLSLDVGGGREVFLEVEVDVLNWKEKAISVYTGDLCHRSLCKSA